MGVKRRPVKRSCPLEHKEQSAFVAWARDRGHLVYRIHNGGNRSGAEASQAAREGELAGVPDLFFPKACGQYHGLYIEMKRQKGGVVSDAQEKIHRILRDEGYRVDVCRGAEEAKEAILRYIAGEPRL